MKKEYIHNDAEWKERWQQEIDQRSTDIMTISRKAILVICPKEGKEVEMKDCKKCPFYLYLENAWLGGELCTFTKKDNNKSEDSEK